MKWEAHYIKIIDADNFFDAVDKAREMFAEEEVISVCQYMEDDMIL